MANAQNQSKVSTPERPISQRSTSETRELYRQKYEAQMREWSAKIEEMKANADKFGAEAKLGMKSHLDTVNGKYEAAKAKLADLADTADDKWDDVKNNAEGAWNDFKSSIEGAYDALRGYGKTQSRQN